MKIRRDKVVDQYKLQIENLYKWSHLWCGCTQENYNDTSKACLSSEIMNMLCIRVHNNYLELLNMVRIIVLNHYNWSNCIPCIFKWYYQLYMLHNIFNRLWVVLQSHKKKVRRGIVEFPFIWSSQLLFVSMYVIITSGATVCLVYWMDGKYWWSYCYVFRWNLQ